MKTCEHVKEIKDIKPKTKGCGVCEKTGDEWVSLRLCLTCGEVGCCDSSKNMHARKHFDETSHSIIKSMPLNEDSWKFCYEDNNYLK